MNSLVITENQAKRLNQLLTEDKVSDYIKKMIKNNTSSMLQPYLGTLVSQLPEELQNHFSQACPTAYKSCCENNMNLTALLRLQFLSYFDISHGKGPMEYVMGLARIAIGELGMFNENANDNDLSTLKQVVLFAHNAENLSVELDGNLNGWDFRQIKSVLNNERKDYNKKNRENLTGAITNNANYEVIPITSFEQASQYGKYTSWCVTHQDSAYSSYVSGGRRFYFCLEKGFQNVPEDAGKTAPLDEYGLSMVSILVDMDGEPNYVTTRWNHEYDGENNENFRTPEQVQKILGIDFYNTFKPYSREELKAMGIVSFEEAEERLANGEEPRSIFNGVGMYEEGFAWVSLNNKYNFMDEDHKLLCDTWFDYISPFSEGFAVVQKNGEAYYINRNGEDAFGLRFTDGGTFVNGIANVERNGKVNHLTSDGKLVSQQWYDWASGFDNDVAQVELDGKCGFINLNGELLGNQLFDTVDGFNYGITRVEDNNKANFLRKDGTFVSEQWFDEASELYNGISIVCLNYKWNYITDKGNILSPQWFDYANGFYNGIAKVELDDKANFIKKDGGLVSKQWFDDCYEFREGFGKVRENGDFNFIDENGELISNQWFYYANDFHDGFATVQLVRDKWNVLNTEGKLISKECFRGIEYLNDKLFSVYRTKIDKETGKELDYRDIEWNILTTKGELVSDIWFDNIRYLFYSGTVAAYLNGKIRLLNGEGKPISDSWFTWARGNSWKDEKGNIYTITPQDGLKLIGKESANPDMVAESKKKTLSIYDQVKGVNSAVMSMAQGDCGMLGEADATQDNYTIGIEKDGGEYYHICEEAMPVNFEVNGEQIKDPENICKYNDADAYAFGEIDGKMYIGEPTEYHDVLCSKISEELGLDYELDTDELEVRGRFWKDKKTISFWWLDTDSLNPGEIKDTINKLNDVAGKREDLRGENFFDYTLYYQSTRLNPEPNCKGYKIPIRELLHMDKDNTSYDSNGMSTRDLWRHYEYVAENNNSINESFFASFKESNFEKIYNSSKELKKIGTFDEYTQYTQTIFPDSKIRYIVYHATPYSFEKFQKGFSNPNTSYDNKSYTEVPGFWFAKTPGSTTYFYSGAFMNWLNNGIRAVKNVFSKNKKGYLPKSGGNIYKCLINITNPYEIDRNGESSAPKEMLQQGYKSGADGIIFHNQVENYGIGADEIFYVFSPDNIYILGGKQDSEGFGTWKSSQQSLCEEINPKSVDLSSFKVQSKLNPDFWKDDKLDSKIRLKLLDIADDFIETLDVSWAKPKDIIMTGSLANYNWNKKYSDIDLHIIMNFKDVDDRVDFVKHYFDSQKNLWNKKHEKLEIKGFPVEVYVQNESEPAVQGGIYSIQKDKWIKEPDKEEMSDKGLNKENIKKKVAQYMDRIEEIEQNYDDCGEDSYKARKLSEKANALFDEIKKQRGEGLNKDNKEMTDSNIIFKALRRFGYLDRLDKMRNLTYDKEMSLNEIHIPKITAYHGTPHDFIKFRADNIGSGEGNQSFGYGLYFTDNKNVAEYYADLLGKGEGYVYTVEINEGNFFSWLEKLDKELIEEIIPRFQEMGINELPIKRILNPTTREIKSVTKPIDEALEYYPNGKFFYENVSLVLGGNKEASDFLHTLGFIGIKYPVGAFQNKRMLGSNYVIFSGEDVHIVNKRRVSNAEKEEPLNESMGIIDGYKELAETIVNKLTSFVKRPSFYDKYHLSFKQPVYMFSVNGKQWGRMDKYNTGINTLKVYIVSSSDAAAYFTSHDSSLTYSSNLIEKLADEIYYNRGDKIQKCLLSITYHELTHLVNNKARDIGPRDFKRSHQVIGKFTYLFMPTEMNARLNEAYADISQIDIMSDKYFMWCESREDFVFQFKKMMSSTLYIEEMKELANRIRTSAFAVSDPNYYKNENLVIALCSAPDWRDKLKLPKMEYFFGPGKYNYQLTKMEYPEFKNDDILMRQFVLKYKVAAIKVKDWALTQIKNLEDRRDKLIYRLLQEKDIDNIIKMRQTNQVAEGMLK